MDHNILSEKLVAYGFENRELQWCQSYVPQRKQVVQLGNTTSSEMFIMNGGHQSLILGPLFLLTFITDLALHVPSQTDLFGDDTSIMESADYRNIFVLSSSLNKSMSEKELWAKSNKLPLNKELMITGKSLASKLTEKPMINIGRKRILKAVESATLLGLEIDSKQSFTKYVEKVCKKLASQTAILSKNRGFFALSERLQYYEAVIRPVMSFSDVIWSECDKDLLKRILRLQKRAARVILFADRFLSSVLINYYGYPFMNSVK